MNKDDLMKEIKNIYEKNKTPFFCIKTTWGRYYFGNKAEVFQDQIFKDGWKISLVLDNNLSQLFSIDDQIEWIRDLSIYELSEMFSRL